MSTAARQPASPARQAAAALALSGCAALGAGCPSPPSATPLSPTEQPQAAHVGPSPVSAMSACPDTLRAAVRPTSASTPLRTELARCTRAALRTSPDRSGISIVVINASRKLVSCGQGHQAVELACELRSPILLVEVAAEIARRGPLDDAIRLTTAIDRFATVGFAPRRAPAAQPQEHPPPQLPPRPPLDTSSVWGEIALRQAKLGLLRTAESTVAKAALGYRAQLGLASYDYLAAKERNDEAAQRLAQLAETVEGLAMNHSSLVVEVAVRMARAGDPRGAATLLREEHRRTSKGKWGQGARDELASGLSRIGTPEQAVRLLRADRPGGGSEEALGMALTEMIDEGNLEAARQTALVLQDPYWQARSSAEVAAEEEKRGLTQQAAESWKRAHQSASQVEFPRFRVESLAEIAEQSARTRRRAQADAWLAEAATRAAAIREEDERKSAVRTLVASYAKVGRCARALELAATVQDDGYSIREAAVECENPAEYDLVLSRTAAIRYPDHRSEAVAALAIKYAQDDRWQQALSLAQQTENAEQRAWALASMAALADVPPTATTQVCSAPQSPAGP